MNTKTLSKTTAPWEPPYTPADCPRCADAERIATALPDGQWRYGASISQTYLQGIGCLSRVGLCFHCDAAI